MKILKRSAERGNLFIYLDVVDDDTMLQIGNAVDISETGMKILCDKDPGVGISRNCTIVLPESLSHLEDLSITAICRWVGPDINPDFLAAGFEFNPLTGVEKLVVQTILEHQTFDNN